MSSADDVDDSADDERQGRYNDDDAGHSMGDDGSNRHAKEDIAGAGGNDAIDTQKQRSLEAWP